MRIQEVVGIALASRIPKDIENMMLKPKTIKVSSGHDVYVLRSDHFITNLIAYRKSIGSTDLSVHPTSMLGFLTSGEAFNAVFNDKQVQQAIRVFDDTKPKGPQNPMGYKPEDEVGGYYTPPRKLPFVKRPDPAKGEIGINKRMLSAANRKYSEVVLGHEFMHRGLMMANWNKGIKRNINAMMFKAPYNAWGSHKTKYPQFKKSYKRFGNQLAALEHIMIYAWEGTRDGSYQNNPQLFKTVPGFENSPSWKSAKAKGIKLLDMIGEGATAYIITTVQRINNIPDEAIDQLIIKFAKLRGMK